MPLHMLYPNKTVLKQQLETLPHTARVAFALACAERLTTFVGQQIEPAEAARAIAHQFVSGAIVRPAEIDRLAAQQLSGRSWPTGDMTRFPVSCRWSSN